MAYRRTRLMAERLAGNRERILLTTRKLVAEGGFRHAQIAAVAAEAGVSTGMIYRYFPSKAELFVEVLTAAVDHEIAILEHVIAQHESARTQLDAAVASFVRRALTGPNLAYAFIAEPVDPEVEAERIRCRRLFGDVFRRIVADGVEAGTFPQQDTHVAAACIVGAFTEALVGPTALSRDAHGDEDALVESICVFCLRAAGA